jgi:pimeloyl-ACP methyl ester carboxylesterase
MAVECGAERYIRHQQAIIDRPDARSRLRDIGCPTLVLVGAADTIAPPIYAYGLAEGISGARLAVIPRCGHLAPLERPQAVSAALAEWIGG